ncbi:M24 family metallopeptidase [Microbacterium ulmi]|uniref:Aminopeptidase P family protein n=1 Tax=Microbacterium ulmi TaxID=179095 RepID=A0A7Y2PZB0_9MICO|nr:M24 family metallopeptidase [Microbacterium ulmi]NII70978.1 Xaa-Pro aminopeptidase [Microbacterium ulmi]NNH04256.1 aminopeptidase P family protein [Microbacterium ulmi]
MSRLSLTRPHPPKFPEHPLEEHEHRVARARRLMEIEGLDALVVSRNVNVYYLSGTRFFAVFFQNTPAIVPQSMVVITKDADVYGQRFGPFDSDDVGYDTTCNASFEHFDSELELASILSDYGIGAGMRVGIEWGPDSATGINPVKFLELRRRLEGDLGVELVDSTALMRRLVSIKSPLEIERTARAVSASARALNRVMEEVELGMTATELSHRIMRYQLEEGAESSYLAEVMGEGDGSSQLFSTMPVDTPVEPGWVHFDISAVVGRYHSDVNRGLFLGRGPTRLESEAYAVRRGVNDLLDTLIKPGVSIDAVVREATDWVEATGFRIGALGGAPFVGHSLGMEFYIGPNIIPRAKQPALAGIGPDDDILFEEGMVFAFECSIEHPSGVRLPFFNVEDNAVVTSDGVRVLSDELSRDLVVRA